MNRKTLFHWYVLIPGLTGFLIAMAISWSRWPTPSMHDDFGNLLVASTLLEGRLSNPVPEAWESMETFHVVFQPSYASKYPIGLGFMLAVGKLIFGTFAAGLWLCSGLASAAIAWMIAAHFPRRWAMASGLATATHPFWQNGWSQEFTNGWLAVTGISLVLGGLLRIRRRFRSPSKTLKLVNSATNSLASGSCYVGFENREHLCKEKVFDSSLTSMVGLGCVITLFSRPFEGGLVCGLLGLYFLPTLIRRHVCLDRQFWKAALPGALVLTLGVCFQLIVNHSITGQVTQLPYQLHESQYGVAPVLIWQKPHEPTIGHRFAEQVVFHHGWSMNAYNQTASFFGYFAMLHQRMVFLVHDWGKMLACAPLGLLFLRPERRRFIGLIGLLLIAILVINCIPWAVRQYVSPLIPIAIFIGCAVSRGLIKRVGMSIQISKRPIRIEYASFVFVLALNMLGVLSIAYARSSKSEGWEVTWAEKRAEIIRELASQPQQDLVFVRYPSNFDIVNSEWVFNDADISNTPVLWVRWGTTELNQRVTSAYPTRKVWLLQFNEKSEPTLSEFGL
jgi:hypothetical protein